MVEENLFVFLRSESQRSVFQVMCELLIDKFCLQDNGKESRLQRGNLEDQVEQGRLEDNRFREGEAG